MEKEGRKGGGGIGGKKKGRKEKREKRKKAGKKEGEGKKKKRERKKIREKREGRGAERAGSRRRAGSVTAGPSPLGGKGAPCGELTEDLGGCEQPGSPRVSAAAHPPPRRPAAPLQRSGKTQTAPLPRACPRLPRGSDRGSARPRALPYTRCYRLLGGAQRPRVFPLGPHGCGRAINSPARPVSRCRHSVCRCRYPVLVPAARGRSRGCSG